MKSILKLPSTDGSKFKRRQKTKPRVQTKVDPQISDIRRQSKSKDQRERAKTMGNYDKPMDVAFLSLGGRVVVEQNDARYNRLKLYQRYNLDGQEMLYFGSRKNNPTEVIFAYPSTVRHYVTYGDPFGRLIYIHNSTDPSKYIVGTQHVIGKKFLGRLMDGVRDLLTQQRRSIPKKVFLEVAYKDGKNVYFIVGTEERDRHLYLKKRFFISESNLISGVYVKKEGVAYKFSGVRRSGYTFKKFKSMSKAENRMLHGFVAAAENALNLRTLPLYWKPDGEMEKIESMQRQITDDNDVAIAGAAAEGLGVDDVKRRHRRIKQGPKMTTYQYDGPKEPPSPSSRNQPRAGKAPLARTIRQIERDGRMVYNFTGKEKFSEAIFDARTDGESVFIQYELSILEDTYPKAYANFVSEGKITKFIYDLSTSLENNKANEVGELKKAFTALQNDLKERTRGPPPKPPPSPRIKGRRLRL